MLKVENLKKTYAIGNFVTKAVDNLSIEFRESEFVAILGPSGCGKTTLLNILGTLDQPDSGTISLYGNNLSDFTDIEFDRYRNHTLGFIFQTHNLISHLNILENVELGMTLSGVRKRKRRKQALSLLDAVGLRKQAKKKPVELSVGQRQRVAIARALANNPDIVLADEPTGSVDSQTGIIIMDLIKKVAKGKLVIMVTHDEDLANKYADRVIRLSDGKVISDSNPYDSSKENKEGKELKLNKIAMSLKTALSLALGNLKTKKGRAFFTAIASSIGLIGISLILALSGGVNREVTRFQRETNGNYPINISIDTVNLERELNLDELEQEPFPDELVVKKPITPPKEEQSPNLVNNEYGQYVLNYYNENPEDFSGLTIKPKMTFTVLKRNLSSEGKTTFKRYYSETGGNTVTSNQTNRRFTHLPNGTILNDLYDLIAGEMPEATHDPENKTFGILLYVNQYDRIIVSVLENLGYTAEDQNIMIESLIGTELLFHPGKYSSKTFVEDEAIKLKITGIIRPKHENNFNIITRGFGYTSELIDYVKTNYPDTISDVDYINIYPANFKAKDEIKLYLDAYNNRFADANDPNFVEYFDRSSIFAKDAQLVVFGITIVLIAFSSISLIVSSIMIATITYTSVIERTKEIGVMRAIGARKKDISRIFNTENFIIGLSSGALGVAASHLLTIPLNMILEANSEFSNIAHIEIWHVVIILCISLFVALVAGIVPSKIAANKNPVEALRIE